jgi:hypothetical protein
MPGPCRLQQERLLKKQAAQDKLQRLVAPLLALHDPQTLAFNAFGAIRPRITLRFEEMGVRLRDGTVVLAGVTGRFSHSTVCCIAFLCLVYTAFRFFPAWLNRVIQPLFECQLYLSFLHIYCKS